MPGADQEHQGHLGDLVSKTTPELKDLLRRQESILQKQNFVRSLPDGGRKIRASAEKLHSMIVERQRREERHTQLEDYQSPTLPDGGVKPLSQFAKLRDNNASALNVDDPNMEIGSELDLSMQALTVRDPDEPDLSHLINPACTQSSSDKVYVKEEPSVPQSVNSYLKVIQKSNQPVAQTKQHFKPHSSLNITAVSELPQKFRGQNVKKPEESHMEEETYPKTNTVTGRLLDEKNAESSATPPKYKCDKIKVISLEESFQLQKAQAQKQEELRAQQAAERLTGKHHVKMEPYLPEGKAAMIYRTGEEPSEDLDSDDNEEEDYPD